MQPSAPDPSEDLRLLAELLEPIDAASRERVARVRAALRTFIALIATNHTIDKIRRLKLELTSIDSITVEHEASRATASAWCPVETREHAALAQVAVGRLSASDRAFVSDVFCDERDPAEHAREAGVSTTALDTRKTKVRDELRRLVGEPEAV